MASGMTWSEEHIEELKRLAATGMSAREIAGEFNAKFGTAVTRNAIIGKLLRANIPLKNGNGQRNGARRQHKNTTTGGGRGSRAQRLVERKDRGELPAPQFIAEPVAETNVDLLGLENGMCRWPVRDGFYCGGATGGNRITYCPAHRNTASDSARMQRYAENRRKKPVMRGRTFKHERF